jgi:hypothetical protein
MRQSDRKLIMTSNRSFLRIGLTACVLAGAGLVSACGGDPPVTTTEQTTTTTAPTPMPAPMTPPASTTTTTTHTQSGY